MIEVFRCDAFLWTVNTGRSAQTEQGIFHITGDADFRERGDLGGIDAGDVEKIFRNGIDRLV